MPINRWMDKEDAVHNYSAIKKSETMPFANMDGPGDIIISEVS